MLKFHLRLLLLISTITIISFIGLGAIIHNTIYQTLTSNQIKSLDSEAVIMLISLIIIKRKKSLI